MLIESFLRTLVQQTIEVMPRGAYTSHAVYATVSYMPSRYTSLIVTAMICRSMKMCRRFSASTLPCSDWTTSTPTDDNIHVCQSSARSQTNQTIPARLASRFQSTRPSHQGNCGCTSNADICSVRAQVDGR